MNQAQTENLENIASHVVEHFLPEIRASVDTCVDSYNADPFNDSWTFGTHLWKNLWNRLKTVSELEDCPFEVYGKGNEYTLKIDQFILRHHRVNNKTKLPTGAKAVKEAAAEQMTIYSFLGEDLQNHPQIPSTNNIVIAINATASKGLLEVFVGELIPVLSAANKFEWATKAHVFLADGQIPYAEKYEHLASGNPAQVPVEQLAEPETRLVRIKNEEQKKNK